MLICRWSWRRTYIHNYNWPISEVSTGSTVEISFTFTQVRQSIVLHDFSTTSSSLIGNWHSTHYDNEATSRRWCVFVVRPIFCAFIRSFYWNLSIQYQQGWACEACCLVHTKLQTNTYNYHYSLRNEPNFEASYEFNRTLVSIART